MVSPAIINTKVRRKDIIADTLPFDSAVNKDDANILIPTNKKLIRNDKNIV